MRKTHNSLLEGQQRRHSSIDHVDKQCNCPAKGKQTVGNMCIAEWSIQTPSKEFKVDVTNPYNLTVGERDKIKKQNHQLISQFQSSPSRGKEKDSLSANSKYVNGGGNGNRRTSIESTGTLYNISKKPRKSIGVSSSL